MASALPPYEGKRLNNHDAIKRLLSTFVDIVPPRPPVSLTEVPTPDLGKIVSYIASVPPKSRTPIQVRDMAMTLLRIVEPVRSEDLHKIPVHSVQFLPSVDEPTSVRFSVYGGKTSRARLASVGKAPLDVHTVGNYEPDSAACPVLAMKAYYLQIKPTLDQEPKYQDEACRIPSQGFFRGIRPPYGPIKSSTIANRIVDIMKAAGIPTTITAHSLRGAATSASLEAGVSAETLFQKAVWGSFDTFAKHYSRAVARQSDELVSTKLLGHVLPMAPSLEPMSSDDENEARSDSCLAVIRETVDVVSNE